MQWKPSCRVGEITLCARRNSIVYPPRESNRDRLCGIIDTILAEQPKDFEVFLQKLIQQGYEVKRGKHTAAKGKEQKISSADELRERATAATERYHAMGDSIKAAETRLAEIAMPRFASWYPPSIQKAIWTFRSGKTENSYSNLGILLLCPT